MRIKTRELEGAALDWAVAKAVKAECHFTGDMEFWKSRHRFAPSSSWMFGGELVERYKLTLYQVNGPAAIVNDDTGEHDYNGKSMVSGEGDTILIAAMRAIVASELGDSVDVPDELVEKANG